MVGDEAWSSYLCIMTQTSLVWNLVFHESTGSGNKNSLTKAFLSNGLLVESLIELIEI